MKFHACKTGSMIALIAATLVGAQAQTDSPQRNPDTLQSIVPTADHVSLKKPYPHYKVIDTGSLGGPNSHIHLGAHVLNNAGVLTVSADTPDTILILPTGASMGIAWSLTPRTGSRGTFRTLA
jgi:hypothetical protein